jgi:hypothetical protein
MLYLAYASEKTCYCPAYKQADAADQKLTTLLLDQCDSGLRAFMRLLKAFLASSFSLKLRDSL